MVRWFFVELGIISGNDINEVPLNFVSSLLYLGHDFGLFVATCCTQTLHDASKIPQDTENTGRSVTQFVEARSPGGTRSLHLLALWGTSIYTLQRLWRHDLWPAL